MKLYIGANTKPLIIDIVVELYGNTVTCAKTVPCGKLILTPQEKADFTDFVEDIGGLIDTLYFELMEEHPSRYSDSASYYYTFYPTDSNYNVCYENLYFLRISTHERQSEKTNPFPKYYPDTAQKYKMPETKTTVQHHRKLKVIVNNATYDNYDDAFEAVKRKFENIQKQCDKLNTASTTDNPDSANDGKQIPL